jgi:hypothetical protein
MGGFPPQRRRPVAGDPGFSPQPGPPGRELCALGWKPKGRGQLSPEEQVSTGVTQDYIRPSIGLENVEDIQQGIEQALAKATSHV